jgi:hypothetical protein
MMKKGGSVAKARATDPQTSHDAADSLGDLRESEREVYELFQTYGPMTDLQLVQYARMNDSKQSDSGLRTRRSELVEARFIRDSGHTARTPRGQSATVWELTGRTRTRTAVKPGTQVRIDVDGRKTPVGFLYGDLFQALPRPQEALRTLGNRETHYMDAELLDKLRDRLGVLFVEIPLENGKRYRARIEAFYGEHSFMVDYTESDVAVHLPIEYWTEVPRA